MAGAISKRELRNDSGRFVRGLVAVDEIIEVFSDAPSIDAAACNETDAAVHQHPAPRA